MTVISLSEQEFSNGMTSRLAGMTTGRAEFKTKLLAKLFQSPVSDAELTQMADGVLHIVAAAAKLALSLIHQAEDLLCGKLASILGVGPVDDVGERFDRFLAIRNRNTFDNLEINMGELFPLAQISQRLVPSRSRNFKHNTPARPAPVKSEDEAWRRWCTSVLMRVDAETAVESVQRARQLAQELETRPPHQRTPSG